MSHALPGPKLGECVDDAVRRGLVDLKRLRRLTDRLKRQGHRRLDRIQGVLAARSPGYRPDESDFETRMNRLWDELGLPPAERQFRLRLDGRSYRLDRALVAEKIAVEWDSDRYHTYPSDLDHDSNRTARLVAAGWLVIRATANTTPELVANAVQRARQDRAMSAIGFVTGQ
jgi:very-short-patch-repair endonuclease